MREHGELSFLAFFYTVLSLVSGALLVLALSHESMTFLVMAVIAFISSLALLVDALRTMR